ncbi:helix-turn-helix domain-containing protein [Pseudoneobacillus sp. C159]
MIEIRIKIREILRENNISLRELSRRTDINHGTLSALFHQKREKVHLSHIIRICEALKITDPCQIFEFILVEGK